MENQIKFTPLEFQIQTSEEILRHFYHEFAISEGLDLQEREKIYISFFHAQFNQHKSKTAVLLLQAPSALAISEQLSAWYDAWVSFSWEFVKKEHAILLEGLLVHTAQELDYHKKALEQKEIQATQLKNLLYDEKGEKRLMEPAEFRYYDKTLQTNHKETELLKKQLEISRLILPQLTSPEAKGQVKDQDVLLFARGGYARADLSFTSDIDIAYALDPSQLSALEQSLVQESFKRLQGLLSSLNVDFASQYVELGEDLSRFGETNALHAIPSILEGRILVGDPKQLQKLKLQFREVCPTDKIIRFLEQQTLTLESSPNNELQIKEGIGGIRHLQYALWVVLILFEEVGEMSTVEIFNFVEKQGWISTTQRKVLTQTWEFYLSFRNFIGLFSYFEEDLKEQGADSLIGFHPENKNIIDDQISMAFLKVVKRFTTVDQLDRFRLFSMGKVARLSKAIMTEALDRQLLEVREGFVLLKHLGSNQIQEFLPLHHGLHEEGEVFDRQAKSHGMKAANDQVQSLFLDFTNLFDLFIYISTNGYQLSQYQAAAISNLLPELYEQYEENRPEEVREFIYQLFTSEFCSVAVRQMVEISTDLSFSGEVRTLLGLFLPAVNRMRYLLRNLSVHQHPLCEHSMRALGQVEKELVKLKQEEPEFHSYLDQDDLFALKWSVFFHDLGKVNPYRDHEVTGPSLSTKMLMGLGWDENEELLNLIRLLVRHHQSVVRFSQLSTHMDLGILRFLTLAENDPEKIALLFLVNISDFKSVNDAMNEKAGPLERFFEKTLRIFDEVRHQGQGESLSRAINRYLDQKVMETRDSVMMDLLFTQCSLKSPEEVLFIPLEQLSEPCLTKLLSYEEELQNSVKLYNQGKLQGDSMLRHRQGFARVVQSSLSRELIAELMQPYVTNEDWFFTSFPNRYLLGVGVDTLRKHLVEFHEYQTLKHHFVYEQGEKGEYDTLLFSCQAGSDIQTKIAYLLGRMNMNIENGKINQIYYLNGQVGVVGYLQVSQTKRHTNFNVKELESQLEDVRLPELSQPSNEDYEKRNLQIQLLPDTAKPYLVNEVTPGQFERVQKEMIALKVSLYDAPFYYFKMMAALTAVGVHPEQLAITTIGRQIIDYFYISTEDQEKLSGEEFSSLLQDFLHFELT